MKKALVIGATGQDGSYLTRLLLEKGYKVVGGSRDSFASDKSNLKRLSIENDIEMVTLEINDFRSIANTIKHGFDEIYNLAGQTSVALSFSQPVECIDSIVNGTLNLLEAIKFLALDVKLFNAGSSEIYGNSLKPNVESSTLSPMSPYGVAKSGAYWLVDNYRKAYNIYACTGILSNHESPLRPSRFVIPKIISGLNDIKANRKSTIQLGNISIVRDWGWAPEYVEAMHLMLQAKTPRDYIIATGRSMSLCDMVKSFCAKMDLDYESVVTLSENQKRPLDIETSLLDPRLIFNDLSWKANVVNEFLIDKLLNDEVY